MMVIFYLIVLERMGVWLNFPEEQVWGHCEDGIRLMSSGGA